MGNNWFPVGFEIAKIDGRRNPYAQILVAVLPYYWHLEWVNHRKQHITFTGETIRSKVNPTIGKDPGRFWRALRRDLEYLISIEYLSRYLWDGVPWCDKSNIHLYPASWMGDRCFDGIKQIEGYVVDIPMTGFELKQYRVKHGLSQAQLADQLGVSSDTVYRSEKKPGRKLSQSILDGLLKIRQT